jgi:hypothetical protein
MCDYRLEQGYISSCNKKFKIHYDEQLRNDRPGKIYISTTYLVKSPIMYDYLEPCTDTDTPKGYVCYKYSSPTFVNDCLKFAEGLTINEPGYNESKCILQDKYTGLLIGHNDKQNMKIASRGEKENDSNINKYANPKIGESYAFVLKKLSHIGEAPYHIGHVLFKDETTNITLEANAGDEGATQPKFDMYDTELNSGYTFHEVTMDNFDKSYQTDEQKSIVKDYITIVLKKREDEPITKTSKKGQPGSKLGGSKIKPQQKSRNSKQTKKNKRI